MVAPCWGLAPTLVVVLEPPVIFVGFTGSNVQLVDLGNYSVSKTHMDSYSLPQNVIDC